MRIGIFFAVLIGGIISLAVLIAGTSVMGEMTFPALMEALVKLEGPGAGYLLGLGLFAAGFTSSMTAPLASAITGRSLLSTVKNKWASNSSSYRLTWGLVLFTGFLFGISNTQPVPVIIAAQAINGLLLPFITVFLLFIINDSKIMMPESLNKKWQNLMMLIIVLFTCFLGIFNIYKAISKAFAINLQNNIAMTIVLVPALTITIWAGLNVFKNRKFTPGK
jgi:Mn2+/Fe2+ NRAMP family transporter